MNGLRITDAIENYGMESEQVDALRSSFDGLVYAAGLEDNGGFPDGNTWLLWDIDADEDQISHAVQLGAQRVKLYQADYHASAWNDCAIQFSTCSQDGEWNGLSGDDVAVFTDPRDAALCQRTHDLMQEDDDLETLPHRLNAF